MKPLSTIKSPRPNDERVRGSTFTLSVVEGVDTGLSVSLDAGSPRLLIGQSPACEMRLNDPEVSRRHASMTVEGPVLAIFDLGSTNGTTVNGVTIEKAKLHGGEAVRMGRSVLAIARGAEGFAAVSGAASFGRVLGSSAAMRKTYPLLEALAASDRPVLIEGEVGTGKDLVAEEIAAASIRKDGPFIVLECQDLANADITALLFNGDGSGGPPLFEQARGGVLLIDEIGDLPRDAQKRLRAAMSESNAVRVIGASRRDLDRDVADGRFSEALFAELAPGRVELPPLRERLGDVGVLARALWRECGATGELPADFLPRFEHYPWPGNVRELKTAIVSRMTLGELGPSYRTAEADENRGLDIISSVLQHDLPFSAARERVNREFERRYVERILAAHGGNVTHAARASGVALRYFKLVRSRLKGSSG